ncbi:hypothetical protein T11_9649 [Trichinella zimbabwensis]|uniref:Uncharacterized protein n=1 Tax=Trichinella zimbabwensis TaxID=268475 RepID=A0A0V1I4B9_9BILA|nr:hypothetical protein T11_9649 [Trichinella zimbabwensis]
MDPTNRQFHHTKNYPEKFTKAPYHEDGKSLYEQSTCKLQATVWPVVQLCLRLTNTIFLLKLNAGRRLSGKIVQLCREIFNDALRKKANRPPPGEHRLLSKFHWPTGLITAPGGNGTALTTFIKLQLFNLLISIIFNKKITNYKKNCFVASFNIIFSRVLKFINTHCIKE